MKKLKNKVFRDTFVAEHVRTWIAHQVTALRKQRGLTQEDLAKLTRKQQSVISRLEDPDYEPVKISVLLDIASALDIALSVRFVTVDSLVGQDTSRISMEVSSYGALLTAANAYRKVNTSGHGSFIAVSNPISNFHWDAGGHAAMVNMAHVFGTTFVLTGTGFETTAVLSTSKLKSNSDEITVPDAVEFHSVPAGKSMVLSDLTSRVPPERGNLQAALTSALEAEQADNQVVSYEA